MSGEKMERARNALNYSLQNLRPDDTFSLIRFSSDVEAFERHFGTRARRAEATFGKCHRETTIRAIVSGTSQTLGCKIDKHLLQRVLEGQIQSGWHAAHETMHRLEILAASELAQSFAEKNDHVS